MSRLENALALAFALVVWGVVALTPHEPRFSAGDHGGACCAGVGSDCGCLHRDVCSMPCHDCCGPNGMADCWANPHPEERGR